MSVAFESAGKNGETERKAYKFNPPSLYVVDSFYTWLMEVSADLNASVLRSPAEVNTELWHQISAILAMEARLLDQKAFQPWLGLYVDECAYWIPSGTPVPDPRTVVTLEFHDRRRLLDRAARLETGFAYSQYPASRTSRQWSGLEIWPSPGRDDEWRARCNFTLAEFRNGFSRLLSGWNGFVIRQDGDGLRLVVKQINLIDCDRPQGNNSFFL